MKFLLMNGPNLNLLGQREPDIYGTTTLAQIEANVREHAQGLGAQLDALQSNHEGALIDAIHGAQGSYDGIVYNPGAHAHYSYALRDAIASVDVPVVEVHISDISQREEFRRHSVLSDVCIGIVQGMGVQGYVRAVDILANHVQRRWDDEG